MVVGGRDLGSNNRLRDLIALAKKASLPKDKIDTAIDRGQGVSSSGKPLEALTIELMGPGNVAMLVDCLTDLKARTLEEIRIPIKKYGGRETSCAFAFSRKGRVIFESELGIDDILDEAIEAGAEDVDTNSDGNIVVCRGRRYSDSSN
jgi:transcriptional/translational regulatory protein YebC/TACO1